MQLVANGPEIPDPLLQAHEEGRVVFFCGAGISHPAGLPGFKGLVDEIYRLVGTKPTAIEEQAYTRNQFDATLDLLERRVPGQRRVVREALAQALQPKLRRKGAVDTHAALLHLARTREGAVRLVTTNFDRIFARLSARERPPVPAYPAPALPIPKNSRWNGVVYLHGLLPEHSDESALNRLVLTSGDFGLAYLTERWAARFVSELFSNYVVCFVGYSINDPVLRYMMDALAADRMLGEITPNAYALGDTAPGQETVKNIEWEAKGVVPILYEVPDGSSDHSALHRTLKAWAEIYRDGILGRERIVVDYASTRPSISTRQDDFVGRMVWALSHDSGLPAKRFAEFNPVPSLDWLEALSADRYRLADLARFGVTPRSETDKLLFSLLRRPAPYSRTQWMALASPGRADSRWDDVMWHLARWLVRHLDDPALILWLTRQGGQLHEQLIWLINGKLEEIDHLEREGHVDELSRIRADASNAIPRQLLRIVWRLFVTGRVKSAGHEVDVYRWKDRFLRDGLTTTLRIELRELLTPKVALRAPLGWPGQDLTTNAPERLREIVDWEIVLTADHVQSSLRDLAGAQNWIRALPELLDDFQQLLRDALDLQQALGESTDRYDRSNWDLPSISPHCQNRHHHDWATLIELTRDAWLAVRDSDHARAERVAEAWFAMPYPAFKRLALFAASDDHSVDQDQWVDWLAAEGGWWLWSEATRREALRLIVLRGSHLLTKTLAQLEYAILEGPPREMYRQDMEPQDWVEVVDTSVWLRLAKLKASGAELSSVAAARLAALSTKYPDLRVADDERDEFSHWTSGTGDPGFEAMFRIDHAPRKRRAIVSWLKNSETSVSPLSQTDWRDICRDRFVHCALALCDLAREREWPATRWGEALQVWSDDRFALRSWRFVGPTLQIMPDDVLIKDAHSVTWWLEAASKVLDHHLDSFLELCRRILNLASEEADAGDQFVYRAINHPIGHVTQALLNLWFRRAPNDGERLPADLERLFSRLCDTTVSRFRHGRVLLASRAIALFRVDKEWTEAHLLPLFDWRRNASEARAVWEGFLWSPRLYGPLLIAVREQLLETAAHYSELGAAGQQFAAFITYAALEPPETFSTEDFRAAFARLPEAGLRQSADALVQALDVAGEQREDYWTNRVVPFWQNVWPKDRRLASNAIAENLARLSIVARDQFPDALMAVLDWIQPLDYPQVIVHILRESRLCQRFAEAALTLLNATVGNAAWPVPELRQCLIDISSADPNLSQDPRYRRLDELCRRLGA
jgi:hypothetical protein